jgi:hypothetical protein
VQKFWLDTLERFLATVVEAFCGSAVGALVLNATGTIPLTTIKAAAFVGLSTALISALAFIKALAARYTGNPNSASLATLGSAPVPKIAKK